MTHSCTQVGPTQAESAASQALPGALPALSTAQILVCSKGRVHHALATTATLANHHSLLLFHRFFHSTGRVGLVLSTTATLANDPSSLQLHRPLHPMGRLDATVSVAI